MRRSPVSRPAAIKISSKALRFARLAAEEHPAFSHDPRVLAIERKEKVQRRDSSDRLQRYVDVSEDEATFCVQAMTSLLETPGRFDSSDWDGNDYAFMQSVVVSLREQIERADAIAR